MDVIDPHADGFFSEISPAVVDEEGTQVVISEGAQALPQMNGSEMVRNLRAAMSLEGTRADELEAAVAACSAATTREGQRAARACRHCVRTPIGRQHSTALA